MLTFPKDIIKAHENVKPTHQRVYMIIKDSICSGKVQTKEKLTEEAIAKAIGCSRTPVRTAMQKLQSEGFLENLTKNNYGVKMFTAKEKRDLLELDQLLEGHAAYLAAKNGISADDMETLEELNDMLSNYTDISGHSSYIVADAARDLHLEFHLMLARCCGNSFLYQEIVGVRNQMRSLRSKDAYTEERKTNYNTIIAPLHQEVLEAIKERDPQKASMIIKYEIEAAKSVYKTSSRIELD